MASSTSSSFEKGIRVLRETPETEPLALPFVFRLVNVPKLKNQNGQLVNYILGRKELPTYFKSYVGRDGKIVPATQYKDSSNTMLVANRNGEAQEIVSNYKFDDMGAFVVPRDKPALYEFIMAHPLNKSNKNLPEDMLAELSSHSLAFEVYMPEIEEKKAQIATNIVSTVMGIIANKDKNAQGRERFEALVAYVADNYPGGKQEVSLAPVMVMQKILGIGVAPELANPHFFAPALGIDYSKTEDEVIADTIEKLQLGSEKEEKKALRETQISLTMIDEEADKEPADMIAFIKTYLLMPLEEGVIHAKNRPGGSVLSCGGKEMSFFSPLAVAKNKTKEQKLRSLCALVNSPTRRLLIEEGLEKATGETPVEISENAKAVIERVTAVLREA